MAQKSNESENALFVYIESLKIDEGFQDSILKSIENERTKAGILLGFFFLISIEGLPYFRDLVLYEKLAIVILILLTFYYLFRAFCSEKVYSAINTNKNFETDWQEMGKLKFLKYKHEILIKNIERERSLLSKISKRIKNASLLLFIVIFTLFINNVFLMDTNKGEEKKDNNPMSSEAHELGEKSQANTVTGSENPMVQEIIEKSK